MKRFFKIAANADGNYEEVIINEHNMFHAISNVNMNFNHIIKVVECDERGQELDTGGRQLTIPDVSQRNELLAFIAKVDKMRKTYPIAHDEEIVDMILKANCG